MATTQILSNSGSLEWIEACNAIENSEIEAISRDIAFIESNTKPTETSTTNAMEFKKFIPRAFQGDGVSKLWVLIDKNTLIVKRPIGNSDIKIDTKNINYDAGGRSRVSTITTLFDGKTLNEDDPILWENVGSGSTSFVENGTILSANSNEYIIRRGRHSIPYFSGKSQLVETTFDGFGDDVNVIKRAGYFSSNPIAPYDLEKDGFWLEKDEANNILLKVERIGVVKAEVPFEQWDNYEVLKDYDFDNFTVLLWDFLWLGGTEVRLFIKTKDGFFPAHTYIHAGATTGTFIESPNKSVRYELRSIGGTGTLNAICSQVGTEGAIPDDGKSLVLYNSAEIAAGTKGVIYALKGVKKRIDNRDIAVAIQSVSVSNTTANDTGIILLIINPTLSAPINYVNNGKVSDGTATNQTVTPNTGRIIAAFPSGLTGQGSGINNTIYAQIAMDIDNTSDELILAYLSTSGNQSVYGVMTIKEY